MTARPANSSSERIPRADCRQGWRESRLWCGPKMQCSFKSSYAGQFCEAGPSAVIGPNSLSRKLRRHRRPNVQVRANPRKDSNLRSGRRAKLLSTGNG